MQHLETTSLISTVIEAIKSALPSSDSPIALHEPSFEGREWEYLKDCLDTGWVSSAGKYVNQFEEQLKNLTGISYVIATVNGTSSLHLALQLAGVKSEDEVLVPALSFVAPANAVRYLNAIPHFIDSDESSLGISPSKLEAYLKSITQKKDGQCINQVTGRPIRAIVAVHIFGHPCDLDPLAKLAADYGIVLIEDAAEAIGSIYKGFHVGRWGTISVLSFNGNKTITTGGGGALLTCDEKLAAQLRHLSTTGRITHPWRVAHDVTAYNYRMPNLNAALGCAQLEQLPRFLQKKRDLSERYARAFQNVSGIKFIKEPSYAKSNYWLNGILIEESFQALRDEIIQECHKANIFLRPAWDLLCELPMYQSCPKMDLSTAISLQKRLINLPSSASL